MGICSWFKKKPKPLPIQVAVPELERPVLAEDVFTPTSSARRSFIERGLAQEDAKAALKTPGTQLVVYGESGAGKSSLVEHILSDLNRKTVTTHCTKSTSYVEILASVFDELGVYVVSGRDDEDRFDADLKGTVGSDLVGAKFESTVATGESRTLTRTPFVSPQLTAQRVESVLADRQTTWIIEDLHKVEQEVKENVADLLKVFVNRASYRTAVVVIGATETASSIVQAPADVKKRVARIEVKPLTSDELGQILDKGSNIMNVDFTAVRDEIIRLSSGVASVTHALALRCLQSMTIESPVDGSPPAVGQNFLVQAARSYARSMSGDMKEAFESGVRLKRLRKYDNCAVILRAMARLPEHGGTHAEILAKIAETTPGYPPGNLSSFLPQLAEEDRGQLLRATSDGRWRYNEPLQHTYAQILFNIELSPEDPFAEELATQISVEERVGAQSIAEADS